MDKTEAIREILIRRYSKLSFVSVEKIKSKFENMTIDAVIEKHYNSITFSVVLVVIVTIALIVQFISLYLSRSMPFALITNVLFLFILLKGLRDNYEIKEILKMLKEIGLQSDENKN